jgi:hypothetical protein
LKIHMILQGKGGVGKSFVGATLAQYKQAKGQPSLCVDTDPVNATFHGYQALDVRKLDIMAGDEINSRNFDLLVEWLAVTSVDAVIDNGAATFVPLSHYLINNEVPSLIEGMGHELVIHSVITGGQAMMDTLIGFSNLVRQFPGPAQFVVWLNPYWGAIEHDGRGFEQMKTYQENKGRISAIVNIPNLKEETFGRDLSDMLQRRLTFEEAVNMPSLSIMTRQRLALIRKQLYAQLDQAVVL